MSRKRHRKKRKKQPPAPSVQQAGSRSGPSGQGARPASGAAAAGELAEVARLAARGKHSAAVKKAKFLHKQLHSEASEQALVEAYLGRIREMLDKNMLVEAEALVDMVGSGHPSWRARLEALRPEIAARRGRFDALVGPLSDASLPSQRRAEIEDVVRRVLRDPGDLAACETLAADHPLREGARAVGAALEAVTSGPVDDAAVALPQVSRRGPLAPWKWLVRAIAFFYRRDDEACRKCLGAIAGDSPVAKLVPVVESMIGGAPMSKPKWQVRDLIDRVGGSAQALEGALGSLDTAFCQRGKTRLSHAISDAVRECKRSCPELLEELKQRISVRAWLWGLRAEETLRALGGRVLHDAAFWRLLARGTETREEPILACRLWEEFRKHAVHEGWFAAEGAEAAAVFRRMLAAHERSEPEMIEQMRGILERDAGGLSAYYEGQPPSVVATRGQRLDAPRDYFLDPEQLYERICRCDPNPETFGQWLAWAEESGGWQQADPVALRWGEAFPQSAKPFVYLTESCEKRNALKKALKHLSEAEARDGLNPEVRRARLRLLAATANRHIKQGKAHLALKDFAQLDELPQTKERDRPAYVAALRCLNALLAGERPEADRWKDAASRILGGLGAEFLLCSLGAVTRLEAPQLNFALVPPKDADVPMLAAAAARACALGEDVGTPFELTAPWALPMLGGLTAESCTLDEPALCSLIEAALRSEEAKLAYQLSGIGLARSGRGTARFLLLRARSLPLWIGLRRRSCFDAVMAMARRQRDTDLLAEAMDASRGRRRRRRSFFIGFLEPDAVPMSPAQAQSVLAREIEATKYPDSVWEAEPLDDVDIGYRDAFPDEDYEDEEFEDDDALEVCNCPECRRRRARRSARAGTGYLFDVDPYVTPQDDELDDVSIDDINDLDDEDVLDGLDLPDLPPFLLELLIGEFERAAARGEEPNAKRVLDKILGQMPDIPGPSRRQGKGRKKRR